MSSLKHQLKTYHIPFDDQMLERLERYTALLLEWNRAHNLTGAKNSQEVEEHLIDSLYPLRFLPPFDSCADIGTGAGFPGLILAIALPKSHFDLIEPLKKRVAFLHYCVMELELSNVSIHAKRIEALTLEAPDLITSRAVTSTQTLLSLARPLIAPHTSILFYKGERVLGEIQEEEGYTITPFKQRRYLFKQGV